MNHTVLDDRICTSWRYPGGEVGVRAVGTPPNALLARVQDSDALVRLLMYAAASPVGSIAEICIPYLPYARQDRVAVPGDPVAIAVLARLLATTGVTRFATIDAHSPAAATAFAAAGCSLRDCPSTPWLRRYLQAIALPTTGPLCFIAPDRGARGRTEGAAAALARSDRPIAVLHCTKVRDPVTGKLVRFELEADELPAPTTPLVVVDDICDGGGTFLGVATAIRQRGLPQPLHLWTAHGLYSRGLDELLAAFATIGCTDSFRHGQGADRQFTIPLPAGGPAIGQENPS